MYEEVIKRMGSPSSVPRGSRGKPIGMSKAEYIGILNDIGIRLGLGADKGGALSNQIAWITCIPSENCHTGHWNNRHKNCAAAGQAGYFLTSGNGGIAPAIPAPTEPITTVDATVNGNKVSICRRVWNKLKSIFS
jgi:hypothetical protein